MNQRQSNTPAWLSWFDRLDSHEKIRQLAFRSVAAVENLGSSSMEDRCAKLEGAWREIFVPGTRHVEILQALTEWAQGFSRSMYPTWTDYNLQRNGEIKSAAELLPIRCLTGLAGVSKSSLMTAFERICQVDTSNQFVAGGQKLCLYPVRRIQIHAQLSPRAVLKSLANPVATEGRSLSDVSALHLHVRDWLLATGTAVLVVDEMQFLTTSSTASTRVAQLIMLLGALGFPLVFVANYSLVNKLLRRSQEEKDRLLGYPIVLEPPEIDSALWRQVVSQYLKVSPDIFRISAEDSAHELHRLTAGLFRALRQLLLQAYRLSVEAGRQFVTMDDVRQAYRSGQFSTHRRDVEDLASLPVSRLIQERRPDLVCPFPSIQGGLSRAASVNAVSSTAPSVDLPVALLESTISVGAQATLKEIRKVAGQPKNEGKATVVKLPRRTPVSAQSLLDGAQLLRGTLGKSTKATKEKISPSTEPVEGGGNAPHR